MFYGFRWSKYCWHMKINIILRALICLLSMWAATSKFDQLTDIDGATGSFGFRGEALGSISDVSLLEIVTKAHGRPNGYRKVIKAWIFLWKLSNLWIFSLLFVILSTLIDFLPFFSFHFLALSKGCKCLYLGIDDDRQDVGTTGKVLSLLAILVLWYLVGIF